MNLRRIALACITIALAWSCNSDGPNEHTNDAHALTITGPASVATYACSAYTVNLAGGDNAAATHSSDTAVTLAGNGSAKLYASKAACQAGSAINSIIIPKSQTSCLTVDLRST